MESIDNIQGWISPRLNIRFELTEAGLVIYRPDGRPFLSPVELNRLVEREQQKTRAAQAQAETAQARADRFAARLRQLGVDP